MKLLKFLFTLHFSVAGLIHRNVRLNAEMLVVEKPSAIMQNEVATKNKTALGGAFRRRIKKTEKSRFTKLADKKLSSLTLGLFFGGISFSIYLFASEAVSKFKETNHESDNNSDCDYRRIDCHDFELPFHQKHRVRVRL